MELKELLEIAKMHLKGLTTLDDPDFRLEQAEVDESNDQWTIIVSYLVENTNKKTSTLAAITTEFQYVRLYKKLKISKEKKIIGFYIYNH